MIFRNTVAAEDERDAADEVEWAAAECMAARAGRARDLDGAQGAAAALDRVMAAAKKAAGSRGRTA